jgi:hypothetical protein
MPRAQAGIGRQLSSRTRFDLSYMERSVHLSHPTGSVLRQSWHKETVQVSYNLAETSTELDQRTVTVKLVLVPEVWLSPTFV